MPGDYLGMEEFFRKLRGGTPEASSQLAIPPEFVDQLRSPQDISSGQGDVGTDGPENYPVQQPEPPAPAVMTEPPPPVPNGADVGFPPLHSLPPEPVYSAQPEDPNARGDIADLQSQQMSALQRKPSIREFLGILLGGNMFMRNEEENRALLAQSLGQQIAEKTQGLREARLSAIRAQDKTQDFRSKRFLQAEKESLNSPAKDTAEKTTAALDAKAAWEAAHPEHAGDIIRKPKAPTVKPTNVEAGQAASEKKRAKLEADLLSTAKGKAMTPEMRSNTVDEEMLRSGAIEEILKVLMTEVNQE